MGAPLRIVSYNTHLFINTFIPELKPSLLYEDDVRALGIANAVNASGADVVGLCEVWADVTKQYFVDTLSPTYPYSYYQPNSNSSSKLGSGLLLLSKHFLTDGAYTPYTDLVGWDAYSQKGIYTAVVSIEDGPSPGPVFVALTHTQSGSSDEDIAARTSNLEQLWATVRGLPFGPDPVVVMGDLNVVAEDEGGRETSEYIDLRDLMLSLDLQDLCRLVYPDPEANPEWTYNWYTDRLARIFNEDFEVRQRLDYMFVNNFVGDQAQTKFAVPAYTYVDPANNEVTDLSDHLPIQGTAIRP